MIKDNSLKWSAEVVIFPMAITLLLWIVYWFEIRFGFNFNLFGIYPRTASGLVGIVFGPFIHGNLEHLFNNSVPLFVLLVALFYFYRNVRWKILIFGILFTGILTWIIGRSSFHVGASGIVYMLVSFLFFKGVFSAHYQLIALALIVVFLYGGLWWYLFPIDSTISWEGHLSGFLIGIFFALIVDTSFLPQRKYEWEQPNYDESKDPFLRQFDENGNFIENPEEDNLSQKDLISDDELKENKIAKNIKVIYTYKSDKDSSI